MQLHSQAVEQLPVTNKLTLASKTGGVLQESLKQKANHTLLIISTDASFEFSAHAECTVKVSLVTRLWVAGSMLVAVARHTR